MKQPAKNVGCFFACIIAIFVYNDRKLTKNEAAMKKELSPIELSYSRFNENMRFGGFDVLAYSLEQIRKHKSSPEFGKVCNRVMWRLISSAKKANYEEKYGRRNNMVGLLTRSVDWLQIDNRNKRMAFSVLCRENIPFGEKLGSFLQEMNPNEPAPVKSPEEIVKEKFERLSEYFNSSDNFDGRIFMENTKELIELCGDRDTHWKHIHFAPVYGMMQRRAQVLGTPVQKSLFDDKIPAPDTIDKYLVAGTARLYGEYLTETKDVSKINTMLRHKYPSMLCAVVRKNSYTREEVKSLSKILKGQRFVSPNVEQHLSKLGNHLVDIYDDKQAKEIQRLHEWLWKTPKKQPLSQTAQTLVYVDMLYQKLIDDNDIGKEDFNALYMEKKAMLMTEAASLYGQKKDGKPLGRQEVQELVAERHLATASEFFEPVNLMLDKRCRDTQFYGAVIHEIKRRGIKYQYVGKPPFTRRRDNSFEI